MTTEELDAQIGKKVKWKGQEFYANDWFLASDGKGGTRMMVVVSHGSGPIAFGNNAPLEELEFLGPGNEKGVAAI